MQETTKKCTRRRDGRAGVAKMLPVFLKFLIGAAPMVVGSIAY